MPCPARSCLPCHAMLTRQRPRRAIAPAVQAFSEQYTDAVFVKIDVDELEAIAEDFDISAMPTFVAVKGAKEVGRVMGANKDAIEGLVKQHL